MPDFDMQLLLNSDDAELVFSFEDKGIVEFLVKQITNAKLVAKHIDERTKTLRCVYEDVYGNEVTLKLSVSDMTKHD